ncbi:MAG: YebC/PmpR family DNA-binding transcriptional regulator [Syntrophothermus sp.]
MSGHSKWANIKHKKEKADAQRGQAFTKVTREIMVAARQGGPDPAANFRLRLAIEKAKSVNMPNDNIARAIKRGSGEMDGESYEELTYEGYGPGGVAVLLEILTDNRNRTAGDIRHIFSRHGGNLGENGCVSWMFEKKGLLAIEKTGLPKGWTEDDLMMQALEAGAEDVQSEGENYEIITTPADFEKVKGDLEKQGVKFASAEVTMIPKNTVEVAGKEAGQLMRLLDALEEHDDVQNVHTNSEMSDETIAALERE